MTHSATKRVRKKPLLLVSWLQFLCALDIRVFLFDVQC